MEKFNTMTEDIRMEDLRAKRSRFTWSNNRRRTERVWERIDQVLINVAWVTLNPDMQCTNDLTIVSDHTLLILYKTDRGRRKQTNFRFEEIWLKNDECK